MTSIYRISGVVRFVSQKEFRNRHHEMLPRGAVPLSVVNALCRPESSSYRMCTTGYFQIAGPDVKQLNSVSGSANQA